MASSSGLAFALVLFCNAVALADSGGAGGGGSPGVSAPGGSGSANSAGGVGASGSGLTAGGGGGAGVTGGSGGSGSAGSASGGAGAVSPGGSGGAGADAIFGLQQGGGGGGGGAHGAVVTTATTNASPLSGGGGGAGGSQGSLGGGGGGGEGGYGAVVNAAITYTNRSSIAGGSGGNGGVSTHDYAGGGGDGGLGIAFSATGAELINSGSITGGNGGAGGGSLTGGNGNGGSGAAGVTGATLTIRNVGMIAGGNGGAAGGGTGDAGAAGVGGVGIIGSNLNIINGGSISGGLSGAGVRADAVTFTGGTNILQLQAGSTITGNVAAFSAADKLQLGGTTGGTFDVSALGLQFQNFGSYEKTGSGIWTLTGTQTSTSNWVVSGGTLNVSGSITSAGLTTVASGGTLSGVGAVGTLQVNAGGILSPGAANAPGTSMTIAGSLTLAVGSSYQIYVNPTASTFANVIGNATLNGTVLASFAPGGYLQKTYLILHSTGLGGSTFSGFTTANLPRAFAASLSYSSTDAYLNLTALLAQPQGLGGEGFNQNQQSVAAGINNYFNSGGPLPPNFTGLFNLSGGNLSASLSQLAGQAMTGSRIGATSMMTQFMALMLDPCVSGRACGPSGPQSGPASSAQPSAGVMKEDAFCGCDLEAADLDAAWQRRWAAWGAGFGGGGNTSGNNMVGTSSVTASTYGGAAGLDYNYSRETLLGIAIAAGGMNWGLGGGLGGGNSTSFQAGLYGMTRDGPAYASAGLAFAEHLVNTSRSALGDQLTARFTAQSYAARAEGGYRFATTSQNVGITPYGAVQYQTFHTPAYGETDRTGGGFGLNYNASDATDTRTELGARFDNQMQADGKPLMLRGRLAWAHDFITNPTVVAAFQALPGSTFIVNGATPSSDSALASVSGEYLLTPQMSVVARFDGEFSGISQSYAGTASIRYRW